MKVTLDARQLDERGQAHAYLKAMLSLPDYYGNNLDALYDCLTEMRELEVTFVRTEGTGGYFPRVYRIFEKAAKENPGIKGMEHWKADTE